MKMKRLVIFSLAVFFAVGAVSVFAPRTAQAQGSICGNLPCASNQDDSIRDRLEDLTDAAKRLVPTFIQAVHDPLGSYFDNLAYILAYCVALVFLIRLLRQGGDAEEVYWAMARMALMFALLGFCAYRSPQSGQGTDLPTMASRIGNGIAYGGQRDDQSFLGRKVSQRQLKFSNSYSDFVDNSFYYRINGEDRLIEYPDDEGGQQVLTVPNSGGDALQRIANAVTNDRGWSMDRLFQFLNISRGVVEFGDLFLLILNGFLIAAVKMAAPFIVAISIDREFAQRVGKNFAWGAAVVLIVMPIISQIVRWVAYTVGSIPFGHISNPYFVYDPSTGSVVVHGNPEYMIIISGFVMMICGLCMFASPFISYKLAQGGVFEAIAGTVSGWMGALIGTGISMWSAATGASISKQAAETSATAQMQADTVGAAGAYRSSMIGANARHSAAIVQSQTEMMTGINSARVDQWGATQRAGIAAQEKIAGITADANSTLINNEAKRRAETYGASVGLDKAEYEQFGVFGSIVQEGRDAGIGLGLNSNDRTDSYSDYLNGSGQPNDAPFSPQLNGNGAPAIGNFSGWEKYGGTRPFNVNSDAQGIKDAYKEQFGKEMPANIGQRPIHNREGYDHRNAMDVPIDPNSNEGKWLRGYLQQQGIPYRAASRPMTSASTGKITSTGRHIHIGQGSHDSGGQTWAVGTTVPQVSIPQGNQSIRNAPFPVQDKVVPAEKARIETGGSDSAARYSAAVKTNAAIAEAQGLSRVAAQESAAKQQIARAANAGRIRAADIDQQGTINAARVTLNASEAAIRARYEGAMKAANLQRLSTIVTSFGSTIANQAQGAMQQYNRF